MSSLVFEFVDGSREVVWPNSPRHRELLADGHAPVGSVPESDGISDALEAYLDGRPVADEALPERLSAASLSATYVARDSVGDRLRKAAAGALNATQDVMASPPTITTGTASLDATLTKLYRTSVVGLTPFRFTGGSAFLGYAGVYTVAPVVTRPTGTGGNTPGNANKSSWHWSVEFDTDAPKVQLRYLNSSLTYMVEVDGRPVSATGLAYPSTGGTGYSLIDFGSSKNRRIRVWYREAAGFDGVYVGPTYSIWPPKSETGLRVAVVGDSIETGAISTTAGTTAATVAGKFLGWTDVRQIAWGGTGYVTVGGINTFGDALRVADAVAADPDLLMFVASQNDDGQAGLQAAALAAFQAYRTALPDVPIVVCGVHAGSSGPSAARVATEDTIEAAFNQWADGNSWWVPITASTSDSWESGTGTTGAPTGTGNRDRYGGDTSHPNAAGHAYLGQRLANAFRELVLPNVR